jgi:hypothetical protein
MPPEPATPSLLELATARLREKCRWQWTQRKSRFPRTQLSQEKR